jgi:hypothetical protein
MITIPVVRIAVQQIRERFPEAVLAAVMTAAVTQSPEESVSFWQEAERLAGTRRPRPTSDRGSARRIRTVRVADLYPMVRQLLRHGHGYQRPTVDGRFAERLNGEAVAWAREGFNAETAAPWIRAHIASAAAGCLARHGISPQALNRCIPVSAQGELPLSVAIRSGLVSAAQACRILDTSRIVDVPGQDHNDSPGRPRSLTN